MVLQRGLPLHIWGTASQGEAVRVTFRSNEASSTAAAAGVWSVYLPPSEAGGPFELTVQGTNTIVLKDILVGDVWIGSGQSNMEWPVKQVVNAPAELAAAQFPQIRLLRAETKFSATPFDDIAVHPWVACTPESVADFSAVAYFFGRDLHKRLNVPIGLIESSWGGTPAEAWTSMDGLSSSAGLMPVFSEWAKLNLSPLDTAEERLREKAEWERASVQAKAEGKTAPGMTWHHPVVGSWMPAGLYNAMIAPLTKFPIRGAIWYQGESNASAERAPVYAPLFQTLIRDWRRAWGQDDMPFLFVQLANFTTSPQSWWPALRDAQRQALELRNTSMAVTIDIGDPKDIHPRNKQDVGARLALGALAVSYGEHIEYMGPLLRTAAPEKNTIRVWFTHTGGGLKAKGDALKGFEVAGLDGKYFPAEARIDGNTVVVSSPSVAAPVSVRYGWSDNPDCNLYNGAGLPASPFQWGN
jgi:sialate O-acetylesterase